MCPVRPSIRTWVKLHRRCLYLDIFPISLSLSPSLSLSLSSTPPLRGVYLSQRLFCVYSTECLPGRMTELIDRVEHQSPRSLSRWTKLPQSSTHQTLIRHSHGQLWESLLLQEECYTDFTTLLRLSQTNNWVKRRNTWYGWTKKTICVRLPKQSAFLQIFQLVTNSTPPLACQILSLAPKSPYAAQGKETNICLRVTQQSQVLFPSCISL